MNFLSHALSFPGIILPGFIVAAFILAVLLRRRTADSRWRYGDLAASLCVVLALGCAGLALLSRPVGPPDPRDEAARTGPCIEADMLVSRGNEVDLYLNDWQHPPEHLPVLPGQRHIYRFTQLPRDLTLVRLDPSDVPDARMVIYGLTVKVAGQTVRHFGPSELKTWNLMNLSPPREENGGLAMAGVNDDPIVWSPLSQVIRLPESKPPEPPSVWRRYSLTLVFGIAALLLLVVAYLAARSRGRLNRELPPRCRTIVMSPWGAFAAVLLIGAGTVYVQQAATDTDINIEVDMMASRGYGIDLYLNDWQHPPERVPLIAGQRNVYRFVNVPRVISLLRLDPTDQPDAQIRIYGITIRSRTQTFLQLAPSQLKSWNFNNLSVPKEEDGALVLTDTNDDPAAWSPLAVHLPGIRLQVLYPLLSTSDSPFLLAITAFLLMLLARMFTRTGRIQAVLIAVASCVAYPVVLLVLKLNLLPPPSVRSSVGYAAYHGYPKANEYLSAVSMMLVCAGLGYVFARFFGRGANETGESETVEPAPAGYRRRVWLVHASVLAVLLVYFAPNLTEVLKSLRETVYQNHGWDDAVLLHWSELIGLGLRPLRDFWYPYSGSYIQFLPFPTGVIVSVLHAVGTLWILYLGLFNIAGRRLSQGLALFGLIATPILLFLLPGWNRYLLAIDVGILYVAICDTTRLEWKKHAPVAVFVGYVFFYEPTQVIYATAGMVAETALTVIARFQGRTLRERIAAGIQVLKQRLLCVGVPMAAGITASVLVFAALGMLPGLWDFERSIGVVGDYSAYPSELGNWVLPFLQPDTVFLLMFLLASCAVYRWAQWKGERDRLGSALIVLCGVSYMAMQKQVVRPHGMIQMRMFPYMALLIFGLIVWRERRPAARLVIVGFLGCFLGVATSQHLLRNIYVQDIQAGPERIAGSIDAFLHHQSEFAPANNALYDRSRFVGFDKQNAVVNALFNECGLKAEDNIYVLGDTNVFYILLKKLPPYVTNAYNDSPLSEQRKVLDWLQHKKPRFIIVGTDSLDYDSVPHMVRLPLIYTYAVEHYQFLREVGPFHILSERPADRTVDLDYWRRVLGDRVDLGSIPSLSRMTEYAACGGDTTRCDAVLEVKYPASAVPQGKSVLDIESPGGPLRVAFDLTPGQRDYVINLNRLWFWGSLSKPTPPRITAKDSTAKVVMEYRQERGPVLY